jgi:GNAT superfamily N-acetyltransferase
MLETDVDRLQPGEIRLISTQRRRHREEAMGGVYPVLLILRRGGLAVSFVPEYAESVRTLIEDLRCPEEVFAQPVRARLPGLLSCPGSAETRNPSCTVQWSTEFASPPGTGTSRRRGEGRRLHEKDLPAFADFERETGFAPPGDSIREGTAWGVFQEGRLASCAYAISTGLESEEVDLLGFATREGSRRQGYAGQLLTACIDSVHQLGHTALAQCPFDHVPAVRTAQAAGMSKYADLLKIGVTEPQT